MSRMVLGFDGSLRTRRGLLRRSRQAMLDYQRHGAFDRIGLA